MRYEWDESKRAANLARHGVDFMAAEDFAWDTAVETIDDRFDYDEDRWVALGMIYGNLHVLVYTHRITVIRIISLRKANAHEREFYGSL